MPRMKYAVPVIIAPKPYLPVALITDIPIACVVSNKVKIMRMGQASFKYTWTAGLSVYILIIGSFANQRTLI